MADSKPAGAPDAWAAEGNLGDRVAPASQAVGSTVHPANIYDDTEGSFESGIDVERFALEQIRTFIAAKFSGHELRRLVAEVLRAEGFFTQESPSGPDGGIDMFAGRGPLGFDMPHLVVQVKSNPSPVDVKIVRELHGILSTHGADQALLVAWGGVTESALHELRNQFFHVRVWDADKLIKSVLNNYDKLSKDMRSDIQLKQIWSLANR